MTAMPVPPSPAQRVSPAPARRESRAALLNYFSLFGSFSTLICCALPSVLVLLGMGTTVASVLSAAPWLVSLSRHKIWTFSIAGVLIASSFVVSYSIAPRLLQGKTRGEICDADDPTTCAEVSRLSRAVLWGSAILWSCGFFVAYLLGPLLERADR
jgi:mercuric ion transport protein